MAFCNNCGSELPNGANFCHICGHEVGTAKVGQTQRQQVFEGTIHKCPNCGEVIASFHANCPTCGFEFRNATASSAVREFVRKLEEIESGANTGKRGLSKAFSRLSGDTDRQKLNMIQSFSVPNTKEDIVEFMILAVSNIDTSIYNHIFPTSIPESRQMARSEAWFSKIKQTYEKARISFINDPAFQRIEELYNNCTKEIKRQKTKRIFKILILATFPIWIGLPIFVIVKLSGK